MPGANPDRLSRSIYGPKLVPEPPIDLEQLRRVRVPCRDFPNNLCYPGPARTLTRRGERDRLDRCWLFGATLEQILRDEFQCGVAEGRAEEPPLFIRYLEKPARPTPRIASNLGVAQVAHGRQCLIAGG